MFVRKKQNESGVISIQIIDKSSGSYKLLKTIGSSDNPKEVELLYKQGKEWIDSSFGQQTLDFSTNDETENFFDNIREIKVDGVILLLGKIYDEIGFDTTDSTILKHLVIVRIAHPSSKLKSTKYLKRYYAITYNEDQVYRYLDKLYKEQRESIQQISYQHTLQVLNGVITVVFYDVTTLYFQIDDEDQIRKRGFSKEGKHQNPQIVLGLLVSIDGYPLAYEVFEGNKFEGHTMLPVLDQFKSKYKLDKLIIVADSGLLSSQNIKELQEKNYEFILGARIKNEKQTSKDKILALDLSNGESKIMEKENKLKLIISYSEKRAKKDLYNRERGLNRLEKQIKSGKLTKTNINNRGYNKYLKMDGQIKVTIDKDKFNADSKWDGLKGFITNTDLNKEEIIENYGHLWKIEKAFRISKHDLKIRPIYHRLQRRIEAHITINFVAYKVYKELERQLKEKQMDLTPEKCIDIAKTIYSVGIENNRTKQIDRRTILLNDEQKLIAKLFDFT
jgi:transposase